MKTTITQNQIFRSFSRLQRSCCSAVFLLLFLLSASSSWGQITVPINTTGNGTWTCPAGVTSITVECWGGGGGGGVTRGKLFQSAGGGSGGGYVKVTYEVVPGTSYDYSIGAGGSSDNNGSRTWFVSNSAINAVGGRKGGQPANSDGLIGAYTTGTGGALQTTGNLGTGNGIVLISSSYASAGLNGSTSSSGAGSFGAGSGGNGGTAVSGTTGVGSNGNAGTAPGGGGSGARNNNNNISRSGGAGGNGKIVITYTCPANAGTLSGTETVCTGSTTTFSSNVLGGTWSSGTLSVATINPSTGVITPVSAGTSIMTYTVTGTGGCTTRTATRTVTVSATPTNITISPASATICNGQIQSLVASGGIINTTQTSLSSGSINLAIPDNSTAGVSNTLAISGIPSNASITKIDVTFSLTHAWLNDTEITLTAPNGKIITLASDQGPAGSGTYSNAVITSDNSALALSTTSTPITGTYKANATAAGSLIGSFGTNLTQTFSDLFSTQNGNWIITAFDDTGSDLGTLNSWSIVITYGTPQTTWTPTTSLYSDAAATTPYTGTVASTVYAMPAANTTYTATATSGNCTTTKTSTVTLNTSPTTTNASICAGGSGLITVTSSCADLTNQTSGPRDATSGTNVTGVGSIAWTNPGNIAGAGTAGMSVSSSATTNYLRGTGYGFAIPSNAIINGITLNIRKSSSGTTSPYLRDSEVKLVKGNAILSTNKAVTGTNWSNDNVLATNTYGSSTDLWNTTWTPAEINASNFGAVLAATNASTNNSRTATVDWMQITVTYTLPGSLEWYTVSSGGTSIGTGSTFNPVGVANSGLANTNTAGTTSYYVACSTAAGACRAVANFEIKPTPNNATGTNGSSTVSSCPPAGGTAVAITADAGVGNTIKWYDEEGDLLSDSGLRVSPYSPLVLENTIFYAEAYNNNGCASSRIPVEAKLFKTSSWLGGNIAKPTDWFTAANWDCNLVPDASTNVVIPSGKTVSISYRPNQIGAAAYTVTLQGNASLTVIEDHNLTVTNKVTVASGATFTVENDASLVQTDDVTNEGNITVQKSTPSNRLLKRFDAVLWSSPVVQNLQAISTGTPDAYFMEHNPQANSWSAVSNPASANFTKGKGFLIRTPSTFTTTATQQWSVNFTGVPNNGNVTLSAGSTGATEKYLLVGNPYPSAISIAAFRAANTNITGVFYFYRKPNGVTGISGYGTLAANGQFSTNDAENLVGALTPGDVIASGQGFFVAMKSDNNNGEVYFTNAMRVANDHGTFNRMNTNLDSYKLIVKTPVGGNSQMIMNYDSETTNGYDVGYDAVAFTDGTTDFSSIMANEKYRIQSKGEYNAADVIPVQFKTGAAGEHRIKLQDAQGVFAADQMVIIKDNLTGVQHNLTANGDYVFTATAGTFTNRFEVIYQQAYYTALQANSCGATIANMNSLVYADLVNGATGYRFKVVNNTTSAVQTIDRPQHWFAFNMLSAYDYNTPYTISVQVQKDGVWTGYYGATCTVNSPNIAATGIMQINPSQCGMTLPTIGTVIATTPVAGATGYKFRITNTTANAMGNNLVQEITRTNHWFTLAMLTRYNYGSSYAIEVAVKTTAGYTPYGNACTVYAPAVPTLASCGQTVATSTTLVRTTATNLATQYRFQVTRIATQETITFDTANYWFSFRVNVPGYAAGEQYGVRVAVMTAGAWSPYGDACDITAPIATARTTEEAAPSEANLFKPVAYPNPFASTFGISLATPSADVIHVMVYDLQGRLIEKQNVFVSQLDSLQIGTNYPSGDYLLVVAQGANIKSSHIHKD
jgi:subtilisin-like proprotein convertase family protein